MLVLKEPSGEEFGWALGVDEFNIILYKLNIGKEGASAGKVRKTPMGYYTSVDACLRRVSQLEVQSQGLEDLKALDKHIRGVMAKCVDSLKDFQVKYEKVISEGT